MVPPEIAGVFFTSSSAAHASSLSSRFLVTIKKLWLGLSIRASSACEVVEGCGFPIRTAVAYAF
jgi:hypothetical protein